MFLLYENRRLFSNLCSFGVHLSFLSLRLPYLLCLAIYTIQIVYYFSWVTLWRQMSPCQPDKFFSAGAWYQVVMIFLWRLFCFVTVSRGHTHAHVFLDFSSSWWISFATNIVSFPFSGLHFIYVSLFDIKQSHLYLFSMFVFLFFLLNFKRFLLTDSQKIADKI